jgi:hypothetical protein
MRWADAQVALSLTLFFGAGLFPQNAFPSNRSSGKLCPDLIA